jgi:hypothetical protein
VVFSTLGLANMGSLHDVCTLPLASVVLHTCGLCCIGICMLNMGSLMYTTVQLLHYFRLLPLPLSASSARECDARESHRGVVLCRHMLEAWAGPDSAPPPCPPPPLPASQELGIYLRRYANELHIDGTTSVIYIAAHVTR